MNVAVLSFVQQRWPESVVQESDPAAFENNFGFRSGSVVHYFKIYGIRFGSGVVNL